MSDLRPVCIRWIDSNSQNGWVSRADAASLRIFPAFTLGWVVQEDDEQIIISNSKNAIAGDSTCPYNGLQAIPKVAIQSCEDISVISA